MEGIIIMTVAEAIEELKEQSEALMRILDRISALEGRVPGEVLDRLISRAEGIAAEGEAIDNSLSEFITQANAPALSGGAIIMETRLK